VSTAAGRGILIFRGYPLGISQAQLADAGGGAALTSTEGSRTGPGASTGPGMSTGPGTGTGPGASTAPGTGPGPGTGTRPGTGAGPRGAQPRGWPRAKLGDGLPLPWALLTAVAGGLALAAAFPPAGIWPLAPVGPALLVLALWRRRLRGTVAAGFVFGVAFFLPLLSWLLNVSWYAWAALAGAEAVVFALLTVAQRALLTLRAWPVAVAGWWVAAEAVRARWPYAFPWGRLAMSQAGTPAAPWTAIGGAPLLSLLLALTGTVLAWFLLTAGKRRWAVPALALAATVALCLGGAFLPVDQVPPGAPTAVVAAVQGNVPHARNLPDLLRATTVTARHAAATLRLAARIRSGASPAPDLVVWPENSTDLDPSRYPPVFETIWSAVTAINRPVLVGEVLQGPQRNVGQLWLPGRGPGPMYVKRQLVPFGEYIPFRSLLAHVTPLVALQPHDFTPGHRAVVFAVHAIRLGDVICYEVGFDGLVSSEVRQGANLLAVQSNDASFEVDGQRGETLQQLAMARIRAAESNRAVVYVSTTGVSAIIAPDGTVLAHSGTWQQAVLEARVPLVSTLTLADRLAGWPEAVIVALTLAALAWCAAGPLHRRRMARGRHVPPPAD
jgi:apolipoprotein N-acyltransferase